MTNNFQSIVNKTIVLILIAKAISANVEIVTKAEWNGRESKVELDKLNTPVPRIVIIHTAGVDCNNQNACSQQVRNLQHYHMDKMNFDDIAYNFLIGNDGKVYEGRGWDLLGAFARGYNTGSLGIAFIGNYERDLPSQAALDVAKSLIETGVNLGKISSDYKLYGHRQLAATTSPGSSLYETIKQWPNWSRNID